MIAAKRETFRSLNVSSPASELVARSGLVLARLVLILATSVGLVGLLVPIGFLDGPGCILL